MTNSEHVSKYPNINKKYQNNKNVVTMDCKVEDTLKSGDIKNIIDQKMDKYPVNGSQFVVPHFLSNNKKLMHETADNTIVACKVDTPPPSYKSMIQEFLMDEPPQYGNATGVAINVNEVKLHFIVCRNAQFDWSFFILLWLALFASLF